jgi:hypothetical protein
MANKRMQGTRLGRAPDARRWPLIRKENAIRRTCYIDRYGERIAEAIQQINEHRILTISVSMDIDSDQGINI